MVKAFQYWRTEELFHIYFHLNHIMLCIITTRICEERVLIIKNFTFGKLHKEKTP